MSETLLDVRELRTHFVGKRETVQAVRGVSFEVREGEAFGLVGESGCGKSQTLRSVLGLLKSPGRIVGGEILYRGADIAKMKEKGLRGIRGKEISVIFQEPMTSLNPVMRIRRQIYEAFDGEGMTAAQKNERALSLLRLVGIPAPEERIDEYPHQFSGGMRQRAMIAAALASRPRLLLADEPTTALDVTIQDQIMNLLRRLRGELGMSLILVTHDLGVIAQMCDRVAVMYAGIIVEMTDTVTLFAAPRHPYTFALMSSLPNRQSAGRRLETISGSPPSLVQPPPGCPFAPRCNYALESCEEALPPLVEVAPGHLARCPRLAVTAAFEGLIPADRATVGARPPAGEGGEENG